MNVERAIVLVPYAEDPLARLAVLLLERHADRLPDLSRQIVLLPAPAAAARLRHRLLRRAGRALLPPVTATLDTWALARAPQAPLSEPARELALYAALAANRELRRRLGTWPLIEALLALFDEMSLNRVALPASAEQLTELLAAGYGIDDAALEPLSAEARWLHGAWSAWQQQLDERGARDAPRARIDGLARSLDELEPDQHVYLVGPLQLARAEREWLTTLMARGQATLVLHGQAGGSGYHPDGLTTALLDSLGIAAPPAAVTDPYTQFLNDAFGADGVTDPVSRAHALRRHIPASPAHGRLALFVADGAEQQAQAIELQVRRWWLAGARNIGIVTNDRKLARRVRALLERAALRLRDAGGWPLSTTSAATAVMRWLEAVEDHFHHRPLLDLLKSPFVTSNAERDARLAQVAAFEGLLRRHNLSAGLARYREALESERGRLDAATFDALGRLLDALSEAGRALAALADAGAQPPARYVEALAASLDSLGLRAHLDADEAGARVLASLGALQAAAHGSQERFTWTEFRQWLTRRLEREHFRPPLSGRNVELMSLGDSRLYRFDAVIIAGAEREHLPGAPQSAPFFNDGVRLQLGLPSRGLAGRELYQDFRRLLEAAPHVLITLRREQDGEPVLASPWVEQLRRFHQLAYGDALVDERLAALAASGACSLTHRTRRPQPAPFPRARAAELLPARLSASAHQRLIDCPYQFFAADCLGLAAPEEIRDEVEKVDFGRRVHRILQAFHQPVPGLPGPLGAPLGADNRAAAEALLDRIGQAVFAEDVARRFLARGWLYRWQQLIPRYLDWELERAARWRPLASEQSCEQVLPAGLTLHGRLDRVDQGAAGVAILDYKTGSVPRQAEVDSGERTQLPYYALLWDGPVEAVAFVAIESKSIHSRVGVAGEPLAALADGVLARVRRLYTDMSAGKTLPAWGDTETCARCTMEGLCRKQLWQEA